MRDGFRELSSDSPRYEGLYRSFWAENGLAVLARSPGVYREIEGAVAERVFDPRGLFVSVGRVLRRPEVSLGVALTRVVRRIGKRVESGTREDLLEEVSRNPQRARELVRCAVIGAAHRGLSASRLFVRRARFNAIWRGGPARPILVRVAGERIFEESVRSIASLVVATAAADDELDRLGRFLERLEVSTRENPHSSITPEKDEWEVAAELARHLVVVETSAGFAPYPPSFSAFVRAVRVVASQGRFPAAEDPQASLLRAYCISLGEGIVGGDAGGRWLFRLFSALAEGRTSEVVDPDPGRLAGLLEDFVECGLATRLGAGRYRFQAKAREESDFFEELGAEIADGSSEA